MPTTEELASCRGQQVVGPSGDKIGKLEEVYVDSATGKPEWFAVSTGLFGTRLSLIPIAGANLRDDTVQVAYDKAKVKDAPNVDPDGDLSQDQEARLYGHYGLAYS
ncbi:MAG TPA: PRC-barrel domain-containing protein, partial [Thermoleophilaceae bacterium]